MSAASFAARPTYDRGGDNRARGTPPRLSHWTVRLTFGNPRGELPIITNQAKNVLLDHLAAGSPVLGVSGNDLALAFEVVAPDFSTATAVAESTCHDAFRAADLPVLPVLYFEGGTVSAVKENMTRTPDFMGVSEIAEVLQVSRQRAWQHSKTKAFPAAAAELKSGPLWRKGDIAQWIKRGATTNN